MEKSRVKILFPNRSTMVIATFVWEEPDNEISLLNELTEIIERDDRDNRRNAGDNSSIPDVQMEGEIQ